MLKKFGSERLIGMLHAFVLLKPVLSKSLRDREQQVVKITDLTKFDRLKQNENKNDDTSNPPISIDGNQMQEQLDELHESLDDACSSFNRTLQVL